MSYVSDETGTSFEATTERRRHFWAPLGKTDDDTLEGADETGLGVSKYAERPPSFSEKPRYDGPDADPFVSRKQAVYSMMDAMQYASKLAYESSAKDPDASHQSPAYEAMIRAHLTVEKHRKKAKMYNSICSEIEQVDQSVFDTTNYATLENNPSLFFRSKRSDYEGESDTSTDSSVDNDQLSDTLRVTTERETGYLSSYLTPISNVIRQFSSLWNSSMGDDSEPSTE